MRALFISATTFFLLVVGLSCGSNPPNSSENPNTELVVHYNGQEEHRRNTRYINENQLRSLLGQKKEVVIIFGADWCKACQLTRKAIDQAKLKGSIHWVNIEETWAGKLAMVMGIRAIPVMFHVAKSGKTLAVRVGPGKIVSYLALRF